MCYRVRADTQKDVSKLSSRKEESIDVRKTSPFTSESGAAATVQKLVTPLDKEEGGIGATDDFGMKPGAVKREVEKVD